MSIDSIIKQAMVDAGLKPEEEIEKKATGNKLADDLYALASTLEKLGNAKVGAVKAAEQSCLRDLTKAYLFHRMLKSAVEDRLGIINTETEKSAGELAFYPVWELGVKVEYLKAYEKKASEKKAISVGSAGALMALNLALAGGVGYGGYLLGKHTEKPSVGRAVLAWGLGSLPGGIGYTLGRERASISPDAKEKEKAELARLGELYKTDKQQALDGLARLFSDSGEGKS